MSLTADCRRNACGRSLESISAATRSPAEQRYPRFEESVCWTRVRAERNAEHEKSQAKITTYSSNCYSATQGNKRTAAEKTSLTCIPHIRSDLPHDHPPLSTERHRNLVPPMTAEVQAYISKPLYPSQTPLRSNCSLAQCNDSQPPSDTTADDHTVSAAIEQWCRLDIDLIESFWKVSGRPLVASSQPNQCMSLSSRLQCLTLLLRVTSILQNLNMIPAIWLVPKSLQFAAESHLQMIRTR